MRRCSLDKINNLSRTIPNVNVMNILSFNKMAGPMRISIYCFIFINYFVRYLTN